ncbi:MAG: Leucine-responsive regulatory protein [Planctomycetes bacterium ADurb.Bin412]|nr:MAG: Leucine-responsive regulatory protein [Planctomycetes bacterium ADurb.Bin412]
MQPDSLDWKIIGILSKKHITNSMLAKRLGVSEGTIRQRLKKLQEKGILQIRALRDPNILENQQLAMVAATLNEARLLDQKAQEISQLKNVLSVSIVSGRYDFLIEVLVESNKGLVNFLTEQLSLVEGISKTETFVVLKSLQKWI